MSTDQPTNINAKLRTAIDQSARYPVLFFFVKSTVWLAVALVLGIIASVKSHSPGFLEGFGALSTGRAYAAHLNVLLYGWAFQLAFGIIIWLMSRLSRKRIGHAGVIITSGVVWNASVTVGLLGILLGKGTGVPWMEFPVTCNALFLLSYLMITIWSFIQFRVRAGGHVYMSQWYLLTALFLFPWIFITTNLFVFAYEGHAVMAAGVNAWFKSAVILLFFVPVAISIAYYMIPKVTGQPVFSYSLGLFGLWSLLLVAPWAGMQKLAGAPIPVWMPYVGATAAVLFLIPAFTVGFNLLSTLKQGAGNGAKSPTLRFVIAGIVALVVMGLTSMALNIPSVAINTQFSMTGYGYEILSLLGVFGMCGFGAVYYIIPRIMEREWLSAKLIRLHFWFSCYGVIAVVLGSILGGSLQGAAQQAWNTPWTDAVTSTYAYNIFNTIVLILVLLGTVCFGFNLLVMAARLGRQGKTPTLLIENHGASVHGPDGNL